MGGVGSLRSISALLLFTLGLGCNGDETSSTKERCERVRDRLVALEISPDAPQREARARVMRRAMGSEFLERCARTMTEKQRDCALAATEAKAAFACITTLASQPRTTQGE